MTGRTQQNKLGNRLSLAVQIHNICHVSLLLLQLHIDFRIVKYEINMQYDL